MGVAGASRFTNAATLANTRGISAQQPTLLGSSSNPTSLLDAGRGVASSGLGLSSNARALNNQFLSNTADINTLFSLGAGTDATVESAQQQILALRAGLSDSQLAPSLRSDDGGISAGSTGGTVDTEA